MEASSASDHQHFWLLLILQTPVARWAGANVMYMQIRIRTLYLHTVHAHCVCTLYMHGCRNTLEGGGGSARLGKRSKQPMAQLVEVDIPGGPAERVRAPVARDANVDPYIGKHIM